MQTILVSRIAQNWFRRQQLMAVALLMWSGSHCEAAVEFPSGQPAHIVAQPGTDLEHRMTDYLSHYLGRVLGVPARIVPDLGAVPAGVPAIVLATGKSEIGADVKPPTGLPEAFTLETRVLDGRAIAIGVGQTDRGFKRAVQRLVIKSEQRAPGLAIPDLSMKESPWIPRREWAMASWSPEFIRGNFHNPHVDKRVNVWLYGADQMTRYVDMLDWLGYSGGQLQETAIAYAQFGSAEGAHNRLKIMANALRAAGGNVSLFVWAAQFNDYGWIDHAVTYTPAPGHTAFSDPKVRASFERYYTSYAELAPAVDLLIAHFYDAGQLKNREDVFNYMRLLLGKFRGGNPNVKLAVDSWYAGTEAEYMQQLADHGFKDMLFLGNTMPHTYPPGRREALHQEAKKQGIEMGVWGWHTAEIETDQNPNMHVNAKLLSHFYRQVRDGAHRIHPITYWSEMDAYHLLNIFTHYAAAQLLWNPDRDPDELLREITGAMWGARNAPAMLAALQLIQDVRTGPTWDTYWIFLPTYRLGTADPKEDLRRANEAIASLEKLEADPDFVPKIPLPFPPATFIELTLPHLRQIRHFAAFRIQFAEVEAAAKNGATKDQLTRLINAAWDPVREYGNWIGEFGVREAVEQEAKLTKFAKEHGLALAPPGWMRWRDANRLLEVLQNRQRTSATPMRFKPDATFLAKRFLWPAEKARDRLQMLIDAGVVQPAEENLLQLANWDEFCRR